MQFTTIPGISHFCLFLVCVNYGNAFFVFSTGHELAHQWFGNLVSRKSPLRPLHHVIITWPSHDPSHVHHMFITWPSCCNRTFFMQHMIVTWYFPLSHMTRSLWSGGLICGSMKGLPPGSNTSPSITPTPSLRYGLTFSAESTPVPWVLTPLPTATPSR